MRSLTEAQWERYETIVAHLMPLAAEQRAAALHTYRAQAVEGPDVLSLVALRFALPLELDRCRHGEHIGHFTLGEPLAHGGMGIVYYATQDLGRAVALKLIHPAFLAAEPHEAVIRFQQEITLLAKLEHAHIARIYDGGMYQDPATGEVFPFFAMQLVREGIPLTTYAARHALDVGERLALFLRVCEAVAYAHTHGVIHRDLKPANLLVDAEGCPFVIDFGLAQACDPALRLRERVRLSGTPAYLSPEQVSEAFGPVGPASDVYALGVILYELLAGHRPYEVSPYASTAAICQTIVETTPIPLGQLQATCRGVLETIVAMALAKSPAARYPSVTAFHTALSSYLRATTPALCHAAPTVGPWYLADHRLVVRLTQGAAGNAVITVETQASELASVRLRFTIGDETGTVLLYPHATQADTWSVSHTLVQSFASAVDSPPDFCLELPQPEQRLVTALLITWTDTARPVVDSAWLLQPQQVFQETLRRHNGYVLRNALDGEGLALFGVPQVDEYAALHALRAALELQNALIVLTEHVRVGISTGAVYFDPRSETVSMTELGQLVRQVHAHTAPGEIRVEARTYAATRRVFQFHADQELSAPFASYTVLASLSPTSTAPMIGREAEWAALQACVAQLYTGAGLLITLLGEAGIGKSRLVAELRHHWAHQVLWLESHALSSGHRFSYGPFRDLLRQAACITLEEDATQAQEKLTACLQAVLPETWEERLPYFLRLAGVPGRPKDEAQLHALPLDALSHQVFRTALQFFARLAGERPLILALENWHWRDPASTALLTHLVPLVHRLPLLICLVSRPESPQHTLPWRESAGDKLYDMRLTPLSPVASAQLLDTLVPHSPLPADVRTTLLTQARGNPFFLEELVYALPPHGVRAGSASIPLPTTIETHLLARFHELPERLKQILRIAAVLGRRFTRAVVQGTAQLAAAAFSQDLKTLQHLHFVDVERFGEETYQFKHDLIQEVLYRHMLPETRQHVHQQVGVYLETAGSARHDGLASQLAYHYAHAGNWEKARDYLLQAGEQARQVAADAEALQLYHQVLTLCGTHLDLPQWISVHRKMGEALYHRGEYMHAEQLLQQALGRVGRALPSTRWGLGWAIVRQLLQQVGHRVVPRWRQGGRERDPGSITADCVRIYECLGWIDYFTGRETRLLLSALAMLNMAERSGKVVEMTHGLAAVGIIADIISLPRVAGYYHRCAVTWSAQLSHPLTVGFVYFCLAYHEECWGSWSAALEHYQRATDAYWEAGDIRGWASALTSITRLLNYQGRFAEGLEASQRVIPVGQEGADKQVWGWGLMETGWLLERMGNREQAALHLQQALALLREVPDYQVSAMCSGVLGQCYLRQGKVSQACAILETSQRLSAAHGLRGLHLLELRKGVAEAALVMAERAQGAARAVALQQAKKACTALHKECRCYPGGVPHAYRVRGTYAWLQGKPSVARTWWRRSLRAAEAWGARWDLGMTHFEIGRRCDDARHLALADTILTELGVAATR